MSRTQNGAGLTNGITIRGIPLNQAYPGRVFFVGDGAATRRGSIGGSDTNDAGSYTRPFATVNFAVGQCKASRGDVILVLPGHTETISTLAAATDGVNPWTLDVAGIAIVGLGAGTSRPTITIGGGLLDTAARVDVTAANITLKNLLFVAAGSLDIVTAIVQTTAAELNVEGCEFRDGTNILNFLSIVTTSTVDNTSDGLRFADNVVSVLNTTPAAVISVLQAMSRLELTGNYVTSATTGAGAGGEFLTFATKILTDAFIADNVFLPIGNAGKTTAVFITGSGNSTGVIARNYVASLDTGTELLNEVSSELGVLENYYTGTADASGKLWPLADS